MVPPAVSSRFGIVAVLSETIPHQVSALDALMNCRQREPVVARNLAQHIVGGDVGAASLLAPEPLPFHG